MSHIRNAIHVNTPAAQLYLWVIQNIDYRKLANRTRLAVRNPNVNVKAVLFEFNSTERLQCGLTIRDAFIHLHGAELVNKLIEEEIYVRRKPVYNTDGTSRLSNTTFQVIVSWNSRPACTYENGAASTYRATD